MKIRKRDIEMINDNDKMKKLTGNNIGESGKSALRSAWGSRGNLWV